MRRRAAVRIAAWAVGPALAWAMVGCHSGSPPESRQDPPTGPASEPVPDPITHPCVVAASGFDATLEASDGRCEADADCDCYPGGVTLDAGCGGVTSTETAKELHAVAQRFRAAGCRLTRNCAPRLCEPKCVDGGCQ